MFKKVISKSFLVFVLFPIFLLFQVTEVQGDDGTGIEIGGRKRGFHGEEGRRRIAERDADIRYSQEREERRRREREREREQMRDRAAARRRAAMTPEEKRQEMLDRALYDAVTLREPDEEVYAEITRLLKEEANPNAKVKGGRTSLHGASFFNDIKVGELLIKGGADPTLTDNRGRIPKIVENYPQLLDTATGSIEMLPTSNRETSCQYITEPSQIQDTQHGGRRLCMATKVSCTFEAGINPNTSQIKREFQAVCASLPNGQCPPSNDCVLDRSVVEAENPSSSSPVAPQSSSSKGGGGAGIR